MKFVKERENYFFTTVNVISLKIFCALSNFLYFSLYTFLFFGLYEVPFGEGVDTFLDAFRVDVTLADQTLSGLDHGFDPVQVQLHRGGEVLVFLDGGFNCFHSGGQLHMSKGWLLKNGHGIQWGN